MEAWEEACALNHVRPAPASESTLLAPGWTAAVIFRYHSAVYPEKITAPKLLKHWWH